jgi:hypothetical protein
LDVQEAAASTSSSAQQLVHLDRDTLTAAAAAAARLGPTVYTAETSLRQILYTSLVASELRFVEERCPSNSSVEQ